MGNSSVEWLEVESVASGLAALAIVRSRVLLPFHIILFPKCAFIEVYITGS